MMRFEMIHEKIDFWIFLFSLCFGSKFCVNYDYSEIKKFFCFFSKFCCLFLENKRIEINEENVG